MKYFCILTLLLLFPLISLAQKDTSRSFDAGDIDGIEIFADEVFKVNLETHKIDKIIFTTHSEGEYFNEINLQVERLQTKIIITSNFEEILQSGYDKLSAHKVFSLELTLKVPEGLEVYIKSNIATVNASGSYKDLQVELQSGGCNLIKFLGNAVVNTYRGGIFVETHNAVVTAISANGSVKIPEEMNGVYEIKLRSINGDIKVLKN